MAEIVNLNRARKTRDKAADRARAAANRVAHGLPKSERQALEKERQRAAKHLDGQKLTD